MMDAGGLNPMDMIQFNMLAPYTDLVHGIFTRRGGSSAPPFDSLNVGLSTGDYAPHVRENRCHVARHLGFERAFYLNQIHGNDVLALTRESQVAGLTSHGMATQSASEILDPHLNPHSHSPDNSSQQNGNPSAPLALSVADGVVTNIPGVLLVIQVADCQAVVLFDPVKKVVANLHSGWRGSVANIIGRGVDIMATQFGCDPGDIRAGIGPSLGPCCAEFVHYKDELPQSFHKYRQGEYHFDFWAISRDQLIKKGVHPDHIEVAGLCTQCHPTRFFSHRHEKYTGRFAVAAGLCL